MKTKIILLIALNFLATTSFGQIETTAKFYDISIDTLGVIKWTVTYTSLEPGPPVYVEQFKSGRWVVVGGGSMTIATESTTSPISKHTLRDSCKVKFHKGANKYRLSMISPEKLISSDIELISNVSNDDDSLWISGSKIFRDHTEYYEILNHNGDLVFKGEEKTIDISKLLSGSYFFYTKKSTTRFFK